VGNLNLKNNNGFRWFFQNNIHVKGYAFDENSVLLGNEEFAKYFADVDDFVSFKEKIQRLNGLFCIVITHKDQLYLATDITRTLPLFYTKQANNWIVSDDANFLRSEYEFTFLEESEKEFLSAGYVTQDKTLLKDLYQVQAGEVVCLNKDESRAEEYWSYRTNKVVKTNLIDLQNKFLDLYERVAKRLISSVKGNTIVIPLSGGYDSRLLVALLMKYNYTDVVCFTYGNIEEKEITIAREVAKKLNVKLIVISYDVDFFKNFYNLEEFKNYIKFGGNLVSLAHFQDFFAVKYLKVNSLVPCNAVFVPGHSADIFAGTHISKKINSRSSHSFVRNEIKKCHFGLNECSGDFAIDYDEDMFGYSNMEAWSWKERQAKFIVNSLKVYEFYGYEARIPFWDKELADFFKRVPFKFKNRNNLKNYSIESNLYDSVAFKIFAEFGVDIKKTDRLSFLERVFAFLKRKLFKHDLKDINNLECFISKLGEDCGIDAVDNINGFAAQIFLKMFKENN